MANIRKTFNFRNGVQVDEDNFIVDSLGKVGIGTTVPSQFIDCRGNVKVVGILTSQSLETRNVNIAGVTTFSGNTHVGSAITMYPAAGIISATQIHGDGRNLINIPTSQWTDIDVGLGLTSIYNDGFVGVSTNDPRFTLQVGGNNVLSNFQNGVGINSSGNIVATGVITATNFRGDLSGPGGIPAQVTGNLIGNINSTGVSTVTGLGVTDLSVTGVSTFGGTLDANGDVDLGSTASNTITFNGDVDSAIIPNADNIRGLGANGARWSTLWVNQNNSSLLNVSGVSTFTGNIDANGDIDVDGHTELDNANVSGIVTAANVKVSTKLDLGGVSSQGISTSTPQSELHVFNSGISSVLIESGSNESVVTLGRNTNGQTSGAIRYGNKSAGFPYSNEDALDIINYDVGNVNFYLSGGNTAGTGDFHWNYRSNNTRLMTLTNDGKLGIGVTTPINPLHVVGIATFGSNSFFGNNLEIGNNLTVKNNLTVDGSFNSDVTGNLTGNVTGNINSVGFSTLYDAQVTRFLGIGVLASTGVPFKVNAASSAQFSIDSLGEVKVGHDLIVTDSFAVGSTSASSGVDFKTAGAAAKRFMIPPKVDDAGRGNLTGLVAGALIYNTSTNKLNVYNGTAWRQVTDGAV